MRNSNWDAVRLKLTDPFPAPTTFGRLRLWFDESKSAMALAILIVTLGAATLLAIAFIQLKLTPPDQGKPGNPEVKVEQVVLGGGSGLPSDLDEMPDTTQDTTVAASDPLRPVSDVEQVDSLQPTGSIPAPNIRPGTNATAREAAGRASQKLATAISELTRPQIAGYVGLSGLFKVDPSVESVVYVLDKSGSMGGTPLNRVKAELVHGIRALKEEQKFGVIFYDNLAWPTMAGQAQVVTAQMQSGSFSLMPATDTNKKNAENWLQQILGGGGTNPVPAMMMAIGPKPELIMLLSDGEFYPAAVTQITQENQRVRGSSGRIDCVGLGERVQTLQDVAAQNGGRYYAARLQP